MKLFASFLGLLVGGGIATPFLLSSQASSGVLVEKNRDIKVSQPVMVCKSQNQKNTYQVNLVFEGDWTPTGEELIQNDALKDLFFDFVDTKTGLRIDRLGPNSSENAKFKLTLVTVTVGVKGGKVNLQGKNKVGDWEATDCSVNNLRVIDESCDQVSGMCSKDLEFKDIGFEWEDIQNSSQEPNKVEKGIKIKSGSNLKWSDDFSPKAVFKNRNKIAS